MRGGARLTGRLAAHRDLEQARPRAARAVDIEEVAEMAARLL